MLTGSHLKSGLATALRLIETEKDHINAINVYPVADGDTGTNILLTIKGAMSKVNGFTEASLVAREIAEGMLESAKGNSGVILSQFFWGFMESIEEKAILTNADFARALVNGTKMAYMAVDNPVEGTILTVMKAAANAAIENVNLPEKDFLNAIFEKAIESLNETPELLAKLGKPKVIDSGAYGFVLLLEGFVRAAGSDANFRIEATKNYKETTEENLFCSNFLVELNEKVEREKLKEELRKMGNSLVVVNNEKVLKVHIHTQDPEAVKNVLSSLGNMKNVRIERI